MLKRYLLYIFIILISGSCTSNDDSENTDSINIELTDTSGASILNVNFSLILYGFDSDVADQAASIIKTYDLTTSDLPFITSLDIPKNPESLIDPLYKNESARYYLALKWDSNNDGNIGKGDLGQDYDNNSFLIDIKNSRETKRINLKLIE